MRSLFSLTTKRTLWDAGTTAFDSGRTTWDAGRIGPRFVRWKQTRELKHQPLYDYPTTWDAGATTWDATGTRWDRIVSGFEPADPYTANRELHLAYGVQYDNITKWKRTRWAICAAARGLSGRNLYILCCREQNTTLGKEPISPCSRRVTDPLASPFDWTP